MAAGTKSDQGQSANPTHPPRRTANAKLIINAQSRHKRFVTTHPPTKRARFATRGLSPVADPDHEVRA
eukprot:13601936-Alexandrium_andersonii.AAC.1